MNNGIPGWNFESDTCITNNQKKPMGLDQEIVELLWQNGQVVFNSQTNRKQVANLVESRQVQKNSQSTTLRTSEPFGASSNLVQEDETVSWIQYPIEDPLEQEFCSNILSEFPSCEGESYKQIRQFEEKKFTKLDPSSGPPIMKRSEFSGIPPMPAPRFHDDSSQKNNDLGGSCKVLNFSHFSAPPDGSSASATNANFRGKVAGNLSKNEVRECSGMTVGSSYCGSNHIPQDQDVSRASSNDVWTNTLSAEPAAVTDDLHRSTIPQNDKGNSEMVEPALTSSSGGSGSSHGKTCSLFTRSHGLKRKGIDADESEEQSEDMELKSAVGNKASQRAGSSRRNRAAEVHNLSERRRRDRINEKMRALQQLIPHSSKTDKASMLEEAIEYLKSLQLQLQVMWIGSGMAPVMFPGIQHYMSQMGMGMAAPFPTMHNPMQLPRVPLDQSMSVSQTPNQTVMCQNPLLSAFNYQNQVQNPALTAEQYTPYMGYHLMQNASQPMNVFRYGSWAVQQNQTITIPQSNSSGHMSGAANTDDAVN